MREKTTWQLRDGCDGVQLLSLGSGGRFNPEAALSKAS